jgi:Zn-dependent protease
MSSSAADGLKQAVTDSEWPLERLTSGAIITLRKAARHAANAGAVDVAPCHLLVAILERPTHRVRDFIESKGASLDWLADTTFAGAIQFSDAKGPRLPTIVAAATESAASRGELRADDFCLLQGIMAHGDLLTNRVLREAGLFDDEHLSTLVDQELPVEVAELIAANTAFGPRVGTWTSPRSTARQRSPWQHGLGDLLRVTQPSPLFVGMVAAVFGTGFLLLLGPSQEMIRPLTFVFVVAVWLVSLCMHEYGHAAAAYLMGNSRVRDRGYLTLDIRRYTNPLLSFGIPLVVLLLGGLPLPGGCVMIEQSPMAPASERRFVSISGPAANFLCLFFLSAPLALGLDPWSPLGVALSLTASIQIAALIFNLLPVPPFDGWQIVSAGASTTFRMQVAALGWKPFIGFILMMSFAPGLGLGLWALINSMYTIFDLDLDVIQYGWTLARLG